MSRENFPATTFLCDLTRHQMGQITLEELRKRWAAGNYAGTPPQFAKWCMENG